MLHPWDESDASQALFAAWGEAICHTPSGVTLHFILLIEAHAASDQQVPLGGSQSRTFPRSACTTLVAGNSEAERRISTDIKNYKLCLFIQRHSAPVPGWSAWCLRLVKIFPWMALLLKPDVSHSSSRKYRSVEGGFFSLPSSLYSSSGIGFLPSALKCCKRKKKLSWFRMSK